MKKPFFIALASLIFSGCSMLESRPQPGPPPVKPPTAYVKPEIEVISDVERNLWRGKKIIWKKFMFAVSKTHFYIDHVDESKGEFQVHYSGDPQPYVDCGRVANTAKLPGGDKTYEFAAASPYEQYQITRKGKLFQVERRMGLIATTRMSFDETELDKTHVKVNSAYTISRDQTVFGGGSNAPLLLNDTISFNSGETGTFPNAQTKCQPTGKLEAELLSLLN